jgi:predicted metal-dependent HD superfamily phosphohydrolase
MERDSVNPTDMQILQARAIDYYSFNGSYRFYHNWSHAYAVTRALSVFGAPSDALYLAAMWHDVVYIPKSKINEKASADALAYEWQRHDIHGSLITLGEACNLIELTAVADHLRHDAIPSESNLAKLLDCDLKSLGCGYDEFLQNQNHIIMENNGDTSNIEHHEMAGNFLKNFLTCRTHIYHTDYFRRNYETYARQNITRYIETKGQE